MLEREREKSRIFFSSNILFRDNVNVDFFIFAAFFISLDEHLTSNDANGFGEKYSFEIK